MNMHNDRVRVLLKAAYDLLKKQHNSSYVLDLLYETAFYDDAECNGFCLIADIETELDLEPTQ